LEPLPAFGRRIEVNSNKRGKGGLIGFFRPPSETPLGFNEQAADCQRPSASCYSNSKEDAVMRHMRRTIASVVVSLALAGITPVFATIVNVGGGTWNYGTAYQFPTGKHVWSHYVHPTNTHSATAICASQNWKVFAGPGIWANSDVYCNTWDSAAEYWSN
jgi:hypothetical protein